MTFSNSNVFSYRANALTEAPVQHVSTWRGAAIAPRRWGTHRFLGSHHFCGLFRSGQPAFNTNESRNVSLTYKNQQNDELDSYRGSFILKLRAHLTVMYRQYGLGEKGSPVVHCGYMCLASAWKARFPFTARIRSSTLLLYPVVCTPKYMSTQSISVSVTSRICNRQR